MQYPRDTERELRNFCFEAGAVFGNHLIAATHRTDRRFQCGTTCVFETGPRLEFRLLAHHTFTANFLDSPVGVGDDPVSADQLRAHCAGVFDRDRIGKRIA